ncbi:hypothetical protein HYS50_03805 [Candidatus Woesearchaeota archaeon]|nr:hypothetical protein [Candidatus Woesearchaeota archaeon]
MEIKITIEKKYVWLLVLTLVVVGLVVAYGGNNPQQMGHSLGEVWGVAPNCEGVQDKVCDGPKAANWGMINTAPFAALAWDSGLLGGLPKDEYCQKSGTNCPLGSQGLVYKRAGTEQCGGTAFFCEAGGRYAKPMWFKDQFFVNGKYVSGWGSPPTASSPSPILCGWVLCTQ